MAGIVDRKLTTESRKMDRMPSPATSLKMRPPYVNMGLIPVACCRICRNMAMSTRLSTSGCSRSFHPACWPSAAIWSPIACSSRPTLSVWRRRLSAASAASLPLCTYVQRGDSGTQKMPSMTMMGAAMATPLVMRQPCAWCSTMRLTTLASSRPVTMVICMKPERKPRSSLGAISAPKMGSEKDELPTPMPWITRATSSRPCSCALLKHTHDVPMQKSRPALKMVTRRPKRSATYPPMSAPKMQPMLYIMLYQSVKSSQRDGRLFESSWQSLCVMPCHPMQ
ncbi:hypothetical protein PINS_up024374 [Pythium insidiosum]|nr:hypothetical protein PINS_up024374 [Pythium insidiosum]